MIGNKYAKYDAYIEEHKKNVKTAFDLLSNINGIMTEDEKYEWETLIEMHDKSKYSQEEYYAYAEYFYGEEKTDEIKAKFDLAWLEHQHKNKHHHQHWLLKNDDGTFKALDMPKQYIVEMICDWWSFSIKKGDFLEILNWYDREKGKMILSEKTRTEVERILDLIKKEYSSNEDIEEKCQKLINSALGRDLVNISYNLSGTLKISDTDFTIYINSNLQAIQSIVYAGAWAEFCAIQDKITTCIQDNKTPFQRLINYYKENNGKP